MVSFVSDAYLSVRFLIAFISSFFHAILPLLLNSQLTTRDSRLATSLATSCNFELALDPRSKIQADLITVHKLNQAEKARSKSSLFVGRNMIMSDNFIDPSSASHPDSVLRLSSAVHRFAIVSSL